MERNVLHGEKISISLNSVGIKLLNALRNKGQATLFVDALTKREVTKENFYLNVCRLGDSIRNFGITQDDVIGVYSANCIEYFEPVIASLCLGIPVTTFSSYYTIDELQHTANLSKPKIIFCSESTISAAVATVARLYFAVKLVVIDTEENYENCQSLTNFISSYISQNFNVDSFQAVQVNVKEHVAFILYSSGTTGLPKGVMITHHNVNAAIATSETGKYLSSLQPAIGVMPFCHVYGLFTVFFRIIVSSKVIVMKYFDPNVYLKTLQDYKITILQLVPSLAYFLAKSDIVDNYDLSNIADIACTGSPLSKSTEEALMKRLNASNIRQAYGLTETTMAVSTHKKNLNKYGSCGTVLPNISIKIIDVETGKALEAMKPGELCCNGDLIMKGYINDPESTRKTIDSEGWLHTGDIAYYDEDGFIYIVDRLKELIKYKGHQVPPAALEAILLTHPDILDAGVIGIPDEKDGELPLAFIVKAPDSNLTEKDVHTFVNERVSIHKRLRGGVRFVQEIPRNPTGKILRRVLRDRFRTLKSKL